MGRSIGDRRPACNFHNRFFGQGEHPGLAALLIAGDQHFLGLPLQGDHGDLLDPPFPGSPDGRIQAAQVHIGGDDQGPALIDSVPDRHVQGRGLVRLLQRGPGQPGTVAGLGHDLELHRPGAVTGQQVDRELEASVRAPVGDQLGVGPSVGLQLGEDVLVALAGEKESPLRLRGPGSLIGEGSQLIR